MQREWQKARQPRLMKLTLEIAAASKGSFHLATSPGRPRAVWPPFSPSGSPFFNRIRNLFSSQFLPCKGNWYALVQVNEIYLTILGFREKPNFSLFAGGSQTFPGKSDAMGLRSFHGRDKPPKPDREDGDGVTTGQSGTGVKKKIRSAPFPTRTVGRMAWKRLHLRNRVRFFRSPSSELYPQGLFTLRFHPCLWLSRGRTWSIPIGACRTRKNPGVLCRSIFWKELRELSQIFHDPPVAFNIPWNHSGANIKRDALIIVRSYYYAFGASHFLANTGNLLSFIKYTKYVKSSFSCTGEKNCNKLILKIVEIF